MILNVTLIGQMITFALFIWFTMKLIWPPVLKALAARQKKIAEGLAASERAEHELELARHKAKGILEEARARASLIVDQANRSAHQIVEQAHAEALARADRLRAAMEAEMAEEWSKARQALQTQVGDLALQCAEKIIRRQLDRAANEDLIAQTVAELRA